MMHMAGVRRMHQRPHSVVLNLDSSLLHNNYLPEHDAGVDNHIQGALPRWAVVYVRHAINAEGCA